MSNHITWEYIGLIWAYCLFWVFIENVLKLAVYHHFEQESSPSIPPLQNKG